MQVCTKLGELFIKTNRIPIEHFQTFTSLFGERQSADYDNEDFTEAEIDEYLKAVEDFLDFIKTNKI